MRGGVSAGITYAQEFGLWEAFAAAGLNLDRLETGGYSPAFQAKVLKWYEAHCLVETHKQDAVNRKMARQSGRGGRRAPRRGRRR